MTFCATVTEPERIAARDYSVPDFDENISLG
jgi:hypothetical protein